MNFQSTYTHRPLAIGGTRKSQFYALPVLEELAFGPVSRFSRAVPIVLESVLRNMDGHGVQEHPGLLQL